MSLEALEERINALETEVKQLKQQSNPDAGDKTPWWEKIRGQFKDDPLYEEAMRLGREWRQSEDVRDEDMTEAGEDKC